MDIGRYKNKHNLKDLSILFLSFSSKKINKWPPIIKCGQVWRTRIQEREAGELVSMGPALSSLAHSYVLLASQFQFSTALLLLLFCFCCCCSEIWSPVAQAGLGLMSLLLLSPSARITDDGWHHAWLLHPSWRRRSKSPSDAGPGIKQTSPHLPCPLPFSCCQEKAHMETLRRRGGVHSHFKQRYF